MDEWLDTSEGELYEQARELTWDALEQATVDVDNKKIIMPDGARLGIRALADRLAKQFKINTQDIIPRIVSWLTMNYEPQNLSDSQMVIFEEQIERWVKPFESD